MKITTLFGALAAFLLPSIAVAQTEQTVKMTTAKSVGESITLYVNQTRTGVTVDWGNGTPVSYPKTEGTLCEITGTVEGPNLILQGSNRLSTLICADCGLTALDATGATELRSLYAQNNELTSVSINPCKKLTDLNLANNKLSTVGVTETRFPVLENLNLASNALTNTTGSGNSFVLRTGTLQHVNISNNQIKTVYFTANPNLDAILMQGNVVSKLSLTSNPLLSTLVIDDNEISNLTLPSQTGLPELKQCVVGYNLLPGTLDLTPSTKLNMLWCNDNSLTRLSLPTRKLESLACENNQLMLNSFPYYRYKPDNMSYLPQATVDENGDPIFMDISSALQRADNGVYYAPLCTDYANRANNAYRIDLREYLKDANGQGSINIVFVKVNENNEVVELTKASASAKNNECFYGTGSNLGYITFMQPQTRVWGILTSNYYPGVEVNTIHFSVGAEGTDAIQNVMAEDAQAESIVYDLQGRRVSNPRNGLYIINGKKVFVK